MPPGFVVTRSFPSLSRTLGSMPRFESRTRTLALPPLDPASTSMETGPPEPASIEFAKRFQSACSARPRSPRAGRGSAIRSETEAPERSARAAQSRRSRPRSNSSVEP